MVVFIEELFIIIMHRWILRAFVCVGVLLIICFSNGVRMRPLFGVFTHHHCTTSIPWAYKDELVMHSATQGAYTALFFSRLRRKLFLKPQDFAAFMWRNGYKNIYTNALCCKNGKRYSDKKRNTPQFGWHSLFGGGFYSVGSENVFKGFSIIPKVDDALLHCVTLSPRGIERSVSGHAWRAAADAQTNVEYGQPERTGSTVSVAKTERGETPEYDLTTGSMLETELGKNVETETCETHQTKGDIFVVHANLVSKLKALDEAYFGLDASVASDDTYDCLKNALLALEEHPELCKKNSYSSGVGFPSKKKEIGIWGSDRHMTRVLSLDCAYQQQDATAALKRLITRASRLSVDSTALECTETQIEKQADEKHKRRKRKKQCVILDIDNDGDAPTPDIEVLDSVNAPPFPEIIAEPKIDGLTCSLLYVSDLQNSPNILRNSNSKSRKGTNLCNGIRLRLVRALTRGDGMMGEVVNTAAAKLASEHKIPYEIFVNETDGRAINEIQHLQTRISDWNADLSSKQQGRQQQQGEQTDYQQTLDVDEHMKERFLSLEIRGEVYLPLSTFVKINKNSVFASPRHAAAGLLRRQMASEDSGLLEFCAYALVVGGRNINEKILQMPSICKGKPSEKKDSDDKISNIKNLNYEQMHAKSTTYHGILKMLSLWGFTTTFQHSKLCISTKDVEDAFAYNLSQNVIYKSNLGHFCKKLRDNNIKQHDKEPQLINTKNVCSGLPCENLYESTESGILQNDDEIEYKIPLINIGTLSDIPCDGVVYKLNNIQHQVLLSETSRAPRWAFGRKFSCPPVLAKVEDVQWVLGTFGTLTPIAKLGSTRVGCAFVRKATLHSAGELLRRDIRVGDWVYVNLQGDSVPQIEGVDMKLRPENAIPTTLPKICPSCGNELRFRPRDQNHKSSKAKTKQLADINENKNTKKENKNILEDDDDAVSGVRKIRISDVNYTTDAPLPTSDIFNDGFGNGKGVLWCSGGWDCFTQKHLRLVRFFSRSGCGINGLGRRALHDLLKSGMVNMPSDIFNLKHADKLRQEKLSAISTQEKQLCKKNKRSKKSMGKFEGEKVNEISSSKTRDNLYDGDIACWKGWGVKARDNLFTEIEALKKNGVDLERLLFALCIPGLGKSAAKTLENKAKSFNKIIEEGERIQELRKNNQNHRKHDMTEKDDENKDASTLFDEDTGIDGPLSEKLKEIFTDYKFLVELKAIKNEVYVHPVKDKNIK